MKLIDGKAVAERINEETRVKVGHLKRHGITPGLAVVLVGDDPGSVAYVRNKDKTSKELGFYSKKIELNASTTQQELLETVKELNANPAIHGILVQSPQPPQIKEVEIVRSLDPTKDVEGLHPVNGGKRAIGALAALVPR